MHDEAVTGTGAAAPAVRVARVHPAVWARLVIGVVVAVLGTLLLVKVVGSSSGPGATPSRSETSAAVLAEVTGIPASVYDAVGVRSPAVPVAVPVVRPTPPLGVLSARSRPVLLFVGAEYCSFCAAERWPLIAALSRFGTFTSLYDAESSSIDFAPDTASFSFYLSRYHSRYVDFRPYEVKSDVLGPTGYTALMDLPLDVLGVQHALDPSMTLPFVDVANRVVAPEAAFSPVTLVGLSRDQIAGGLTDATNPVTRSIVASANYLSAAICLSDHQRPGSVCGSSGVVAAGRALGLRP